MSPDPDFDRAFAKYTAVKDAHDAIGMAWLRCRSTETLIADIVDVEDPANYYVCRALTDRELTANDRLKLAANVRMALSDDFRSKIAIRMRPKLDRLLLHTSRVMTEIATRAIAHEQLLHRRAARRQIAVRVIHRLGVISADAAPARSALATHDDAEAITILALVPGGLTGYNCCDLLRVCADTRNVPFGDKSFLGAVALEGLAKSGLLDHDHACVAHPLHYIRAVGRLKDASWSSHIRTSIDVGGIDVLAMAVSVAGRLQLADVLSELETRIDRIVEKDPDLAELLA